MPALTTTMKTADMRRLAHRLTAGATSSLVEQVAAMQAESRLAASVIQALLRHVSPSDVFTIRDDAATADDREPSR
jgi:hypothetical protein